MPADRPNILLIVSDQHRLDCLGRSRDYPVQTPNLDKLAEQGAWFQSAFTPIPLCTPARQSLLTGQRPEATGGLWNYDIGPPIPALDPANYSWPRELRALGYQSRYIGKWHVSPTHSPTDFGYDSWVPLESYDKWRGAHYPGAPVPQSWFGSVDPVPTPGSRTHWLASQAAQYIAEAASRHSPWHLRLDFLEPHLPCQPTEEFARRYPVGAVPRWRDYEDPLIDKPYIQRQQLVNWGVENYTWEDWAPTVARYYAIISQLDDAIGTVLRSLDDSEQAGNTFVIYTTDHGDLCGSHGMMDKHYVMYDEVVRVPLILRWPEKIAPGTVVDGFTYNTLDLPPTISTITGMPAPPAGHGSPMLENKGGLLVPSKALQGREHVVSTYNGQQFGLFIQRMIRTRKWKYVWNPTDIDELYMLDDDPEELKNRIGDESCAQVLGDLRRRLYDQLLHEGDSVVANDWIARQLREGRKLASRP